MHPDLMVDLETTGLDPSHNAIIQIAAVRFNWETGDIGGVFNACLLVPDNRYWDQDTLDWWSKQGAVLDGILARARDADAVWNEFVNWTMETSPTLSGVEQHLWAKPTSFEWPYLQSYGRQYGRPLPFHYRNAIDLNSFTRGMAWNTNRQPLDKEIPFTGTAHDAVDDTLHQVLVALSSKEILCSPQS